MEQYRDYLLGRPFHLHTGNQAMALALSTHSSISPPRSHHLWLDHQALSEFHFSTCHPPGSLNTLADLASRVQAVHINSPDNDIHGCPHPPVARERPSTWTCWRHRHAQPHHHHHHLNATSGIPNLMQRCLEYIAKSAQLLPTGQHAVHRVGYYSPLQYPKHKVPSQTLARRHPRDEQVHTSW